LFEVADLAKMGKLAAAGFDFEFEAGEKKRKQ
jgi:hypothetical protein